MGIVLVGFLNQDPNLWKVIRGLDDSYADIVIDGFEPVKEVKASTGSGYFVPFDQLSLRNVVTALSKTTTYTSHIEVGAGIMHDVVENLYIASRGINVGKNPLEMVE